MGLQPSPGILSVFREPSFSPTQTEAVSPFIHVADYPVAPYAVQVIRQHDLWLANCRFLKIIASGITIEMLTPIAGHTDNVANLVQHRMYRRICPNIDALSGDACLRISAKTCNYFGALGNPLNARAEAVKKILNDIAIDIAYPLDAWLQCCLAQWRNRLSE